MKQSLKVALVILFLSIAITSLLQAQKVDTVYVRDTVCMHRNAPIHMTVMMNERPMMMRTGRMHHPRRFDVIEPVALMPFNGHIWRPAPPRPPMASPYKGRAREPMMNRPDDRRPGGMMNGRGGMDGKMMPMAPQAKPATPAPAPATPTRARVRSGGGT